MTGIAGLLTVAAVSGCGQLPSDMAAEPQAKSSSSASSRPTAASPSSSASADRSATAKQSAKASAKPSARTKPAAKTSSTPSARATSKASSTPKKSAEPKAIPAGKTLFAPGDDGKQVREVQARLKQIDWFSGSLTDHYGPTTTAAVKGFQDKRNLTVTGTVDETTWSKLTQMTEEPTATELKNAEPAGKAIMKAGQTSDKIKELQARLAQLDWFSEKVTGYYGSVTSQAVQGFQAKRGLEATGDVDQKTWSSLTGMTDQPTKAELSGSDSSSDGGSTAGLDDRCMTGRAICINKSTSQLTWVVDGKPQLHFDVRFGADTTPTREGAFSVGWKAEDWESTLYHSKMPYSMFFSGGQAVHYSSDFAARGYAGASHGCVNVRDLEGIKSLFSQAQVGDKVIVYRS
ncbi:L,D-transpeptidase family protein [Microlunatus soli]|uniref:L,D-transpeptidase family protein n=1 Tax=Microlunatus soli TaxID=630515 RepID=UPI0012FC23FF|nr:peptidoglycan-binding protein [Microlunatus soli]